MLTFTMSCVWIGAVSWALVLCATNFGCIVGINPVVMGVTVLAAGTSIPGARLCLHVYVCVPVPGLASFGPYP